MIVFLKRLFLTISLVRLRNTVPFPLSIKFLRVMMMVKYSLVRLDMAENLSFKKISDGPNVVTIGSSDRFGGE